MHLESLIIKQVFRQEYGGQNRLIFLLITVRDKCCISYHVIEPV
jgi:hypothetical protein